MKSKQRQFLALYEPIHDRFERFCRARVYGEMEYTDLMNETLLIAYKTFDSLRSKEAFLSYLCSISIRLLANSHRKKRPVSSDELEFSTHTTSSNITEIGAEVHLLHRALSHVQKDQRESLILFEITGLSIREIAQLHEVSESAVKQRLRRGRIRLTEILTFESEYKTGEERIV
ncbi:MAG: RNA polymerase sigma factor [Crocinitomicaceae bacterium]|nr:RNA polymerase sigma factor [Crocinitomicaceae bacterium]